MPDKLTKQETWQEWQELLENIATAKKELDTLGSTLAKILEAQKPEKQQGSAGIFSGSANLEQKSKADNFAIIGNKTEETREQVGALEKEALINAPKSVAGEQIGSAPAGMGGGARRKDVEQN